MIQPQAQPTRPVQRAIRRGLTLDHVWLATALMLIALRPLLTPIPPYDFWWHMATGRDIVTQGAIPTLDSFSYTRAGVPYYNQGWLAELLMYGLYWLGDLPLILIVQSFVVALAYGLLLRLCIIRTGRLRLSVALLLLTTLPLSFTNWVVRPQSYTFPLFVGFLTILTEYRLGRGNRLWLLPLLMMLWVNMHGAFILGLALIGITFVGELLKRLSRTENQEPRFGGQMIGSRLGTLWVALGPLALWGALTALAVLVNPRGLGVLSYVRDLLGSNAVTTLVEEWAPPTIRDSGGSGLIFFLFLISCGIVLIYARRRPDLTDMLLFGVFLWLALGATRNIVWFGFVATPLVVEQAATLLPAPSVARRPPGSPIINAALIGMLALLLLIGLPWVKPHLDLPPSVGALLSEDTPVRAVNFMRQEPARARHLFHTEGYGSYLTWAAPEQPVFIDTRIELYPYEQWVDYINLGQGNNVARLLGKYDIDGLLLNKQRQEGLVKVVRADSAWTVRYEDDQTVYLLRR
jgi:hypothetical protein